MGLFSELCLNTPSDRDLTMHSSHIQTTLVIKMSETARTGHQDSVVLRLSRETRSAIFNYLHFLLFLIFELSPKVIWGCRHIVKYQRKSESVGDRIMVISYINYFLTGRKISHGKEDHWFCCAGQRRRKGSLHTTWG